MTNNFTNINRLNFDSDKDPSLSSQPIECEPIYLRGCNEIF